MALGTGAATNSFEDIEKAKTIMVVGSNTTESHPVVGARIKQMALHGANLIVIDPMRTELAGFARYHLAVAPGTNISLLNAMAQVIVEENLFDKEFVEQRIDGWQEYKKWILPWTPERAAKECNILPRLIREAARLYARESPSICFHGLGITEHVQGTEDVLALINLALLTGNIGKPGTGINPLRGQNNVQGSAAMGCDPSVLTGMASVKSERTRFEELWKAPLPDRKGLNLPQMLESSAAGKVKAMWIVGYDVFLTMPNATQTEDALENLDFLVVQDMFMNTTARKFADVFLPVATAFEKDGTFMNSERRIQRIRKAISPPPDVKTDWEIVCGMAEGMGRKHLFNFSSSEEIWNEIREGWRTVYGITYDRLDHNGIQWPCPDVNHPGTGLLHSESFPTGKRAKLWLIDFKPSPELTSGEYPFILITGRKLYHFNAGTMTYKTPNKELSGSDFLYIHPHDAERLELSEGNNVRLTSRYGNISLPVRLDKTASKGRVFATFSDERIFTNKLTSHYSDNYVQTPEYKITAVRIEKVSETIIR
jgi:formate dehydrogenase major subunit